MNVALQPNPENMELENLEAINWHSFTCEEPLVQSVLGLSSGQLLGKTRVRPADLRSALADVSLDII